VRLQRDEAGELGRAVGERDEAVELDLCRRLRRVGDPEADPVDATRATIGSTAALAMGTPIVGVGTVIVTGVPGGWGTPVTVTGRNTFTETMT
jgi:hypothetical protein